MSDRTTRSRWFTVIALLLPLVLFGAIEGVMRVVWPAGALPLFVTAPVGNGVWRMSNPVVAARWFPGEPSPPAPSVEFFRAEKPANGFRVFVLGESSAQGFPYPRPGSFARLLDAALTDALPEREVEVITLGIAATNSYAMLDVVPEVLAQRPDAVLYYGGHNEYVGALGAGSAIRLSASPALTRLFVQLQHLRTVRALNRFVAQRRARAAAASRGAIDPAAASFMESVTSGRDIVLGDDAYRTGVQQFAENLTRIVHTITAAGVPVYVASVPSNVREQPPFASAGNGAARATFDSAGAALAAGDSARARAQFVRARDLDVVRFRAPTAFDSVVQQVAQAAPRARYVPVREAFDDVAPAGAPGRELFLEHVHPNRAGVQLIADVFLAALQAAPPAGVTLAMDRVRPWRDYEQQLAVTTFDERVALHRVEALAARWPFVPVTAQGDYRGRYVPTTYADTLAFLVAGGARPWEFAKLELARRLERDGDSTQAAAQYVGLAADQFIFAEPQTLAAAALLWLGRFAEADVRLAQAYAITPSVDVAVARAQIAGRRQDWAAAVGLLEAAQRLAPTRSDVLYQLALAHMLAGNRPAARSTVRALQRLHPQFPQLPELLAQLGER
jgi:lysophospholipase L1-like esterase